MILSIIIDNNVQEVFVVLQSNERFYNKNYLENCQKSKDQFRGHPVLLSVRNKFTRGYSQQH